MTTEIGIPYAFAVEDEDGNLTLRECPECGEKFPETADEYGEQTSQNYAEHYMKAHG